MDNLGYIKVDVECWIVQAIPQSSDSDTVVIEVKRLSDGYTWDFDDGGFVSGSKSTNMTHISGASWKESFTPDKEDTYIVTIDNKTLDVQYYQILKAVGAIEETTFRSNSEVSVVNIAMTLLRADRITAINENSENARKANAIFDYCRDETLRAHPWNFAITRAQLSRLASTPTFGYTYAYQLPTNCLRVLEVSDGSKPITDYKKEGDTILTDEGAVYIRYIYRHTDPSKWDASFVGVMGARLAADLAYPITTNRGVANDMFKLYLDRLDKAKSFDGQESSDIQVQGEDEFIESRY